jgi:hypothetical protein
MHYAINQASDGFSALWYEIRHFLFHNLQQWDYIATAPSIWQHINNDTEEQNAIEVIKPVKVISC